MEKTPNRLLIVIENKYNEFGDPVVNFESKDYAECVIEELEKIRAEINVIDYDVKVYHEEILREKVYISKTKIIKLIDKRISELKGEQE